MCVPEGKGNLLEGHQIILAETETQLLILIFALAHKKTEEQEIKNSK